MSKSSKEYVGNVILKKRGRKSKKELENMQTKDTIILQIDENNETTDNNVDADINTDTVNNEIYNDNIDITNFVNELNIDVANKEEEKPFTKKRGRKPKGGKIIQQSVPIKNSKEEKPNIILHLKCSIKDLKSNNLFYNNVDSFNFNSLDKLPYEIINNNENLLKNTIVPNNNINSISNSIIQTNCDDENSCYDYDDDKQNKTIDVKDIWKKLKMLEHKLHNNDISDKKSACFWCTYEFDNPAVYIPKYNLRDTYHVYGCFCSPECATAYLMEENIDSSAKFERYYLINHIYSKIFDYKINIKPAPNPYYMLDKYYGNLSIQEYRSLLRNERLFLIVDKPLTRILPELYEYNDDFIINNKIIPSNTYQIKKKTTKKTTNENKYIN